MMQMKQGLFFSLLTYVLRKNDGRRGDGNHKQENGGDENENEHRGRTRTLVHDKDGLVRRIGNHVEDL